MNITKIKAAISRWSEQRNTSGLAAMTAWLNQGNMFHFQPDLSNKPIDGDKKAYVHAYPGIKESGDLVFFVISGDKDVQSTVNIENYIQVCPITTGLPSFSDSNSNNAMPVAEALARIANWACDHDKWISDNIGTTNSIFQAFAIPQEDTLSGTQHDTFLALKTDANAPGGYLSDLIIEDTDGTTILYFDTIKPIPPFSLTGYLSDSRFYLRSISLT